MSWTKREIIYKAFEEVGYANYAYDLHPEQLQTALHRLDSMMADWQTFGISADYDHPQNITDSSLDDDSLLPSSAIDAVYLNLAVIISPMLGKNLNPVTRVEAERKKTVLLGEQIETTEQDTSRAAFGSGNRYGSY